MDFNNNQYDPMENYRKWEKEYKNNRPSHDINQNAYSSYDEWLENQKNQNKSSSKNKKRIWGTVFAAVCCVGIFYAGFLSADQAYKDGGETPHDQGTVLPEDSAKLSLVNTPKPQPSSSVGQPLSGTEIYKKVAPSVVGIASYSINGNDSTGSGIIMSKEGYIITNNHVVENGNKIVVLLNDGSQYEAEVIGLDAQTDLAVLKMEPKNGLVPAEFGDADSLEVGSVAFAIGSPGGLELQNTLTGGYISAINRDITVDDRVMTLIQTDVAINPGNSGGPLINEYGQVIGINTIKIGISYYEGLGFAIPINSAKQVIDELIAFGHVKGRPAIGISGQNISKSVAQRYDWPQGLYIQSVDPNSDAYTKGLKQGDIIVGVNDEKVESMTDINKIKEKFKAGDHITLNIQRAGKRMDIKIMLMDQAKLTKNTDPAQDQRENNQQPNYYNIPFGEFFFMP